MKNLSLVLCILTAIFSSPVFAQDAETRQAIGLPMKIGENATDTNKGNLSGKVVLEGIDTSKPRPVVTVVAYLNGTFFDRRQTVDTGFYLIPGVPRENVAIAVEIDGFEVARQQITASYMGNIRQDFTVNMAVWEKNKGKAGVVSVKDLYPRNKENEKLFEKATASAKDKKSDEAINLFKKIVETDPKDFVAWTELGTLYFRAEKYGDAEKSYNSALEQKADFMVALINLGKVYLVQKQVEKAIPIFTKAVEVEPNSADAQHFLGESFLQAKKGSKAVVHLNEALRLAPLEKAEIHLRLASLYNAAKMKDKAIEEYKQFLIKQPNHSEKATIEKYIKENSSAQ